MAARRAPPGAEAAALQRCLTEPGYTPPVRALPELLRALPSQGDEQQQALERALARAGVAVIEPAIAELAAASRAQRAPLLALLGRVAGEQLAAPGEAVSALRARLGQVLVMSLEEPLAASRRWAARALAKLGDASAEPALLRALTGAELPEARAMVDALGALGGERSREALAGLSSTDPELERRRQRALALLERRGSRAEASSVAFDQPLGSPCRVWLGCRAGLEGLLGDELSELGFAPTARAAGCELLHGG